MRSEIVLIGPPFAGKSTLGKLLAQEQGLPQVSLDTLRWEYYREIGFDEALAQELRQKGGFLTVVAYWSLFNSHAIERTLADHANCIFDFGGGPIVFDNELQRDQIKRALAPFANVIRLLPSLDPDKSIQILQQRGSHLIGVNGQGFNWSAFFVNHRQNQALAKYELYTEGKTPAESCAEIIALTQTKSSVKISEVRRYPLVPPEADSA
jgi:shikimate kinase